MSFFIIKELTGQKRHMDLGGRSMPYREISFSGKQRYNKVTYPGSDVSTIQVLGRNEDETTIRGIWRRKFLGEQRFEQLRGLADSFLTSGQLIEVEWGSYLRQGILAGLKFEYNDKARTESEVAWEMTFDWISRGEFRIIPTYVPADITAYPRLLCQFLFESESIEKGKLQYLGKFKFGEAVTSDRDPVKFVDNRNSLFKVLQDIIAAIDNFLNLIDSIQKEILLRVDQIRAMTSVVFRIRQAVIGLQSSLQRFQGQFVSMGQNLKSLGDANSWSLNTGSALKNTAREARIQERQLKIMEKQDTTAVYRTKTEEDLRVISRRFYGVSTHWQTIADHNKLKTSKVGSGVLLKIPRV